MLYIFNDRLKPMPYRIIFLSLVILCLLLQAAHASHCTNNDRLQVLGSGGPIADDARASASYLIWQGDQAKVMVDIGSGSILRFAESGASIDTLDAVAITHTHVDHIGDLPALFKNGFFSSRKRPLALLGPDGSQIYPSITQYASSTFLNDDASHRYLGWIADGSGGHFAVPITEIPRKDDARQWFANDGIKISAVGVEHAIVPAAGYVINLNGARVAIPGDMSVNNPRFIELAKGSDILVLHLAIPESANDSVARLHARPSEMGQLAASIQPKLLVISHIMQRAEQGLEQNLQALRKHYDGPLKLATDLACYPLKTTKKAADS